jgi:hypothetical protein
MLAGSQQYVPKKYQVSLIDSRRDLFGGFCFFQGGLPRGFVLFFLSLVAG